MNDWNIAVNSKPQSYYDFWFDLVDGYIDLEYLIDDKDQLKKLNDAINTIENFRDYFYKNRLLIDNNK